MGDIELLSAGIFSSCALIYSAPAALPEKKLWRSTSDAFMTSLVLSGTFLLTDGVWMLTHALWGVSVAILMCAAASFAFSHLFSRALMPDTNTVFLTASAAVLVLTQPRFHLWGESVLSAIGTSIGVILLITALSPALRRLDLSDAPRCVKGLPCALFILGITALAFTGF